MKNLIDLPYFIRYENFQDPNDNSSNPSSIEIGIDSEEIEDILDDFKLYTTSSSNKVETQIDPELIEGFDESELDIKLRSVKYLSHVEVNFVENTGCPDDVELYAIYQTRYFWASEPVDSSDGANDELPIINERNMGYLYP